MENLVEAQSVSDSQALIMSCDVCKQPNAKTCSGCGQVSYCSKQCQLKNWKQHKNECSTSTLAENEELGRYLIAARRIKAGNLVLREDVAIFGPRNSNHPFLPSCLGCCVATSKLCSKCSWPICSKLCESVKHHADNECNHFTTAATGTKFSNREDLKDIPILRLYLSKQNNQKLWDNLNTLQSEYSISSVDNEAKSSLLKSASHAIKKFNLTKSITTEEWVKLAKIFKLNAFAIETTMSKTDNHMFGTFLFLKTSMLANSCSPNCSFTVSPSPSFQMSVRAAVDIDKGQPLTIAYNTNSMFWGTQRRRKIIQSVSGFTCNCNRCQDRSEMGSYMSAWLCTQCNTGHLLPIDPLDSTGGAIWTCSQAGCSMTLTNTRVDNLTTKIYEKISNHLNDPDSMQNPKILFKILEKYSGKKLHRNHWIFVEASRGIVRFLSNIIYQGGGTEEQKNQYFENCQRILTVMQYVSPGISHHTASIKINMSVLGLNRAEDDFQNKTISKEEFQRQIKKVRIWQTEAHAYFVKDTSQTPDSKHIGPEAYTLAQDMLYLDDRYLKTMMC